MLLRQDRSDLANVELEELEETAKIPDNPAALDAMFVFKPLLVCAVSDPAVTFRVHQALH